MNPTDLELIHRDAVSSLYYDPLIAGSFTIWHGFAASADFRAACMRSLALTRDRALYKSISDARQMRVISLADQKWLAEEFFPAALDLRISPRYYSGVIVPHDFFGRQSLDIVTEQVDEILSTQYQGVESVTRYFDNYDDARAWLLTVEGGSAEPGHQAAPSPVANVADVADVADDLAPAA